MNKFPIDPRVLQQAEKVLKKHCAEADEMVSDIGRQIMQDQKEWLDGVMKDLLPPELYDAGRKLERTEEVHAYAKKHGIVVVFIPDTLRLRVMLKGQVKAEFIPQLTVDGEPVRLFTPSENN